MDPEAGTSDPKRIKPNMLYGVTVGAIAAGITSLYIPHNCQIESGAGSRFRDKFHY